MTLIFMTVGFSDPSAPANVYRLNPVSLVRWRDNGAIARNSQHIEALLKFSVASTTYASTCPALSRALRLRFFLPFPRGFSPGIHSIGAFWLPSEPDTVTRHRNRPGFTGGRETEFEVIGVLPTKQPIRQMMV
jgi:hypothetical protein